MRLTIFILVFVLRSILSCGQNIDSVKISSESAFNYDRCNNEAGKNISPYDTTLTHSDSAQCFNAYVMATNKLGIFHITQVTMIAKNITEGYVIAINYPRNFLGIRLKSKKCCYKKIGTWKIYDYDPETNYKTLIKEIIYDKDGPIVLDNLNIKYSDLHEYYREPTMK